MASNALIQSGKQLAEVQSTQIDVGGSLKAGSEMVTNQIEKNLEYDNAQVKEAYELKRMKDESDLRSMDLEARTLEYQEEKAAVFHQIDDLINRGVLKGPDYESYKTDREAFWKDNFKRMKLLTDVGGTERLKELTTGFAQAEQNWANVASFSQSIDISDTSSGAQEMDLAIDGWTKKNPNTPPPIMEGDNGQYYFKVPKPGGDGFVQIPVDKVKTAQSAEDVFGPYDKKISGAGIQADIKASNFYEALNGGYANMEQVNRFIFDKLDTPTKVQEVANSFYSMNGINLSEVAINQVAKTEGVDLGEDGKLDWSDFNGDKAKVMAVMQGIMEAEYGEQDPGNRPLSLDEQSKIADINYKNAQATEKEAKAIKTLSEIQTNNNTELQDQANTQVELGNLFTEGFETLPAIPEGGTVTNNYSLSELAVGDVKDANVVPPSHEDGKYSSQFPQGYFELKLKGGGVKRIDVNNKQELFLFTAAQKGIPTEQAKAYADTIFKGVADNDRADNLLKELDID